jgi:hypothetical protein
MGCVYVRICRLLFDEIRQICGYLFIPETMRFIYSICCLLLWQWNMFAQSPADSLMHCTDECCCAKDYAPVGVMISHIHQKGQWMLSYRYTMTQMEGNQSGTRAIQNELVFNDYLLAPSSMRMHMHMLMGMYGISSRITLMTMFSYMQQSMRMEMFPTGSSHQHGVDIHGGQHSQVSSGLGDTRLYVLWGLPKYRNHQFMLSLGFNLPTGSITQKGDMDDLIYADRHLPYSMQLGSGSVDFLPGLTYLYQLGKWSSSLQLSSTLRYFTNKLGYHRGHEGCFNSWLSYRWLPSFSSSLRIETTASSAIVAQDRSLYTQLEPAANPHNYGGYVASLYGGTLFHPSLSCLKQHRVGIEFGLPIYQYLKGIQQPQQYTVYGSWIVMF